MPDGDRPYVPLWAQVRNLSERAESDCRLLVQLHAEITRLKLELDQAREALARRVVEEDEEVDEEVDEDDPIK